MKILILILLPFIGLAQLPNPNNYTWSQLTTGISYNRDGVECAYFGSTHYVYGGWSGGTITFNNQFRSSDGVNFTATPAAGWLPAHAFASAFANGCMYKVCGDPFNLGNDGHFDSTSWRTSDTSWTQLATNNGLHSLGARWAGQLVYFNGAFYYIGGQVDLVAADGVYNEVWKSTDSCRTFTRINSSTPFTGGLLWNSIVNYKGRMLKIGGTTYDNDVTRRITPREIYTSTDGITWTLAGRMPAKMLARHYQFLIEFDDLLWFGCGYNSWAGNNIQDVWCSDDGINWVQQSPSSMAARHAQACWTSPGELHVMFGTTNAGGGSTSSDGWKMVHN